MTAHEKLIKDIESQRLSKTELCEKMEDHFRVSKITFDRVSPPIKEAFYKEHPNDEGDLFAFERFVGLMDIEESKADFAKRVGEDAKGRYSDFWDMLAGCADDVHTALRHRKWYLAYRQVLVQELNTMDHDYFGV